MMKIEIKNAVTEVRDTSSVSEILSCGSELGEPCLLIVFPGKDFSADEPFPPETPYMTAIAADEDKAQEYRSAADLVIPAGDVDGYTEKLFKDKSLSQIREITACFTAARNGSQEYVLARESKAFYRLMAEKNGGSSNG